jgi:DNA invertase Pin-like site-specific DNA recombinase
VPDGSNGDLREQSANVTAFCEEQGLQLQSVVHDVESAGRDQRPSLAWALEQIAEEKAETLVVARLRDLSSNVANLAPLLSWFNSERRRLIAIDLQLDTSTEAGRLAAGAVAGVGGWEHARMSERTRRGLEAARSRGTGVGRSAVADIPELKERIEAMRAEGMTLQAIADVLNAEGIPTLRGGTMWRPSSVQRATGYRRPSAHGRGIELPRQAPQER